MIYWESYGHYQQEDIISLLPTTEQVREFGDAFNGIMLKGDVDIHFRYPKVSSKSIKLRVINCYVAKLNQKWWRNVLLRVKQGWSEILNLLIGTSMKFIFSKRILFQCPALKPNSSYNSKIKDPPLSNISKTHEAMDDIFVFRLSVNSPKQIQQLLCFNL